MIQLTRLLSILGSLLIFHISINAQPGPEKDYPQIGRPCPTFVLHGVHHYSKTEVSPEEFEGKWLILDFWYETCSACINSLSKTNEMQKLFSKDVQFFLVGITGHSWKEKSTSALFEKFRTKLNLDLPVAYDSILFDDFGITGCPHLIVVDPTGIVRAMTNEISKQDIAEFIHGKNLALSVVYPRGENPSRAYNMKLPLLINGNGGSDTGFLYRSILTQWKESMPPYNCPSKLYSSNPLELFRIDLKTLYRFAFTGYSAWLGWGGEPSWLYGNFELEPILELKDSTLFQTDTRGNHLFSYSLFLPRSKLSVPRIQEIMRHDLENCFDFDARIEVRKMPCLKLIASNEAKVSLRTKNDSNIYVSYGKYKGFSAKNYPIKNLIGILVGFFGSTVPIIDSTGIDSNIDIVIGNKDQLLYSQTDIMKQLHSNGLDLVRTEKEMKVIVINDSKRLVKD